MEGGSTTADTVNAGVNAGVNGSSVAVTNRPKPVVFDIGGRRFRVDVLTRVANALVVATTGTGTGADRLPYTRREVRIVCF